MTDAIETVNTPYRSRYVRGAPEEAVQEFGPITLVSGGGNHPIFNMGFVFDPPTADELSEAIQWIQDTNSPFWLNVADSAIPRIEDLAAEHDISEHEWVFSGMIRPSLDDLPSNESGAEISEVTTGDDAEAFQRVFLTVFDLDKEAMPDQSSDESDEDRSHRFLGRLDGKPVAIGGTTRIGEVANVFGMAVLEEFRGRGIGTAICSSTLRMAREQGCSVATLESTPMAVSMYENVGFESVVEYQVFDVDSDEKHRL